MQLAPRHSKIVDGEILEFGGVGVLKIDGGVSALAGACLALGMLIGQPAAAQTAPGGPSYAEVGFARLVSKVEPGRWAKIRMGLACVNNIEIGSTGRRFDYDLDAFEVPFADELSRQGFVSEGLSSSLFKTDRSDVDLQVGGAITELEGDFCAAQWGLGRPDAYKGKATMSITWEVYSQKQRRVLAKIRTSGAYEEKKVADGKLDRFIIGAFVENVKSLAASTEFRTVLSGPASKSSADGLKGGVGETPEALSFAPLTLRPATTGARSLVEAISSVVAIFTEDGMGSGFVISSDGYLLTNWHVIEGARFVKVRWSDGLETTGEVLRAHRGRDIALIKADLNGRAPLSLRKAPTQIGENVFAIGSPLDPKFQGTLTRGIVSAHRRLEDFNFIQSDVVINHGNSGGAMVDEKGAVVGVAVSRMEENAASVGISFFIPISDALSYLNITVAPRP